MLTSSFTAGVFIVLSLVSMTFGPLLIRSSGTFAYPMNAAQNPRRLALVIGNAGYIEHPLRSPVNDARAVERVLSDSGFEVQTSFDLNKRELEDKIAEFGSILKSSKAIGLFYYSGHGMQINGENFLLPTDFATENVPDSRFVKHSTVSLELVLRKMELAGNRLNIVILDACRDNPFQTNQKSVPLKGLADIEGPRGTFIAFATQPNRIALDGTGGLSPFTESFVRQILNEGKDLYALFGSIGQEVEEQTEGGQVPWIASSLRVIPFCFRGTCKATAGDSRPESNTRGRPSYTYQLTGWIESGYRGNRTMMDRETHHEDFLPVQGKLLAAYLVVTQFTNGQRCAVGVIQIPPTKDFAWGFPKEGSKFSTSSRPGEPRPVFAGGVMQSAADRPLELLLNPGLGCPLGK